MKKIFIPVISLLLFLEAGFAQYQYNQAGAFYALNSYVAVPNNAALNPTSAITLEAWVNPDFIYANTMTIIGKTYQTSYYLGIQSSGRVVFYPKGGASFRSRVSSVITPKEWTHIAATYDGTTAIIYINGVADTSTTAFSGPIGVNTDSLYMGAQPVGGFVTLFFGGKMDNVRIWGTARSASDIAASRFIPLEVYSPTGSYANLRASFQFDGDCDNFSGIAGIMPGYPRRSFGYSNYSNKAVNITDYNNSLVLNGVTDYFTVANQPSAGFNPTSAITLEAWIRRDTSGSQNVAQNIVNKSGGTTRYDYALVLYGTGRVGFLLNSDDYILQSATPVITTGQWTHIAATYSSVTGKGVIYVNGDSVAGSVYPGYSLISNNSSDNIYIGGIGASSYVNNKFKGQIDGVRIWSLERSPSQIKENMYNANSSEVGLTHFYFDKYTNAIYAGGARIYGGASFVGNAHLSSSKLNVDRENTSPMLYDNSAGFYKQKFTTSYRRFFIPDNNLQGITDSIYIASAGSVSNLKVFVLMNHAWLGDVNISLTSPSGTSVILYNNNGSGKNDIMTIFSDGADSSVSNLNNVNSPGVTAPYSPGVKPYQFLSALNGQNEHGWWKIKFTDNNFADAGYVHGWGINIPPASALSLTCFIQGFYNSISNKMTRDTATVLLRKNVSPYSVLDSSKAFLDSFGNASFFFYNMQASSDFYIVVKHRNSIDTWSKTAQRFTNGSLTYNFSVAADKAFGNNMIQVDDSPVRFGVYGGDVTRDGVVDATDVSAIDNDSFYFLTGYARTDLTGDNVVDALDQAIAFNNALNFVGVVRP